VAIVFKLGGSILEVNETPGVAADAAPQLDLLMAA